MNANSIVERIGGRKFIVVLYVLVVTSFLLYVKSIDQDTFKAIFMGVVLLYITGNVSQKVFVKPASSSTDAAAASVASTLSSTAGNGASS